VVSRVDRFVAKGGQRSPQFLELRLLFDSREQLLPDRPDYPNRPQLIAYVSTATSGFSSAV
jgi:hypothetical protein